MDLQRLDEYLKIITRAGRIASCSVYHYREGDIPANVLHDVRVEFECTEGDQHTIHTGVALFMKDGTTKAKYLIRCNGVESVSYIGAEWLRSGGAKEDILWDGNGQLTWSGACNFLLLMVFASNEEVIPRIEVDLEEDLRHIRTLALR